MAHALLLVFADAASPADEAEFNTWYRDVHIPEILAQVPGIVGADRYLAAPDSAAGPPGGRRYLAVYRIEADDPSAVAATLQARVADGSIRLTPALQTDPPPLSLIYLPLDAGE